MKRAEVAYGDLDTAAFFSSFDRARAALRCVSGTLSQVQAARVHRVHGIAAYIRGEKSVAAQHLTAAATLQPDYRFPTTVVAPGHELNRLLADRSFSELARVPVPEPASGALVFDGRVGALRPSGLPTVFQWLDDGEVTRTTSYLMSSDPLPGYPHMPTSTRPAWKRSGIPWIAAGAGTASGLALYGGALGAQRRFNALDPGDFSSNQDYNAELETLKRRNNAMVAGSAVAGALAAVGLTVGIAGRF